MKKVISIVLFIILISLAITNIYANTVTIGTNNETNIVFDFDAAANAYEEAIRKEEETLVEADMLLLKSLLRGVLDLDKDSVQIDNKLYLEFSNEEKNEIYKYMTPNAQKIFEKNTNYFKKGNYNYYDTGRLRTIPFFNGDVELVSLTENKATFDVVIKEKDTDKIVKTYKEGIKLVYKEATDQWLIDSFKFKAKVEKDDTYPEYPVIEEKDANIKKETTSKVDENNNSTNTVKEEVKNNTVISNNTVIKESNISNNIYNDLQDTTNQNNDKLLEINKMLIYLIFGIIVSIIILIIVSCKKVKNKENKD